MAAPRSLDLLNYEMVVRAVAGSAGDLDQIITTLSRPFYNLALRMLHAHHDAEDATQEAVIRTTLSVRGRSVSWRIVA